MKRKRDYIEYEEIGKQLNVNEERKRKNDERDEYNKKIKPHNEDYWNWTCWYG